MKKFAVAGAAAALFAIPAAANAQAYVQVESGIDHVSVQGENETGFGYGVSAGYDMPISGGMFVGIEGTYADSTTKRCESASGDKACIEAGRDVAAVVRLGTAVGPKAKLYVLGGYANARGELVLSGTTIESNLGVKEISTHEDLDGFRLGAGYQYDINDKFFVKAEYRYSNYEQDASRHSGVIAVGAKF